MNLKILIRPEAESDIDESFNWYEDQIEGLGKDFLQNVKASLSAIQQNPVAFQTVHKKIRRAVLKRFPHTIFYIVRENTISIIACVHHKRHQSAWKRKM